MQKYERDISKENIFGILKLEIEGFGDIRIEDITEAILTEIDEIEEQEEVLKITKSDMDYSGYGDDSLALIHLVADALGISLDRLVDYAKLAKEEHIG